MWFIIFSSRHESNTKVTAWNSSEKFMSVTIVAFEEVFDTVSVSSGIKLMRAYHFPTVCNNLFQEICLKIRSSDDIWRVNAVK